ncbi:toll/interleukin-1 receptor domain-containing protein [Paenibacillus rhizolycopersici]|uniref:toll/interleukin-1 receptor domain-containing protein n=1 Tax=Paenibacillus rhizolycopersici TaxID=2780073 RepID=UPI003D2973E9
MQTKPDTVFISYSWSSPEHKQWVIDLAERLEDDTVPVVLDDWDTTEGQDLNKFMERMVNDPEINKVLIICDKVYAEKSDGRLGGVGTETTIASEEVYKKADQTKFIAIVAELDEEGQPYLPTYLKGKKYINMASEQDYEEGYVKLLRNIFRKPENPRPTRGTTPPAWILQDEKKSNQASRLQLGVLKKVADSRPNKLDITLSSFSQHF